MMTWADTLHDCIEGMEHSVRPNKTEAPLQEANEVLYADGSSFAQVQWGSNGKPDWAVWV